MKSGWKYITPYFDNNIRAYCYNGINYNGDRNITVIELESGVSIHYHPDNIKPILKPLKDLKFENSEDVLKFRYIDLSDYTDCGLLKDRLTTDGKTFKLNDVYYYATEMPWDFTDCLISKGYDVFRLIEQEKAIDINTI